MWHKRNFLGETRSAELLRRVVALEHHIQDTEARFAELENRVNVALASWTQDELDAGRHLEEQ